MSTAVAMPDQLHSTPGAFAVTGIFGFCAGLGTFISPYLEGCSIPGRGTGIYTTENISKGQKLMYVPTTALYTTASIPATFANAKARKSIAVHALLAAHLTFGVDGEEWDRLGPWMSMWPQLSDFTTAMPMFWPDKCRLPRQAPYPSRGVGGTAPRGDVKPSFAILPPPTTGSWLLATATSAHCPGGSTSLAAQQLSKLRTHLDSVSKLLPQYASSLRDPHDPMYWRFIHNWCCVNTRCFYYVAPGQKKPADPNEAMALCPAIDLFNHSDEAGCKTKYDKTGYSVVTNRDYKAGEEILLSYGAHPNDVLWAEYGFLLDENQLDAIRIDKLVLDDLSEKQKALLAEYGYLGEHRLQGDGVCWRTEVVAWLKVLTAAEWVRMVQDGWDPAGPDQSSPQVKRKMGGTAEAVHRDTRARRAKKKVVEWLLKAKVEAEASIRGLSSMSEDEVVEVFADAIAIMRAQGVAGAQVDSAGRKQASQRQGMCLKRWQQIWQMCMDALRSVEDECAGSFVTMEPGRTKEDLDATIEDILSLSDRNG